VHCQYNFQIGVALHNHLAAVRPFPDGQVNEISPTYYHALGWGGKLLPCIEQTTAYDYFAASRRTRLPPRKLP